MPNRDLTQLRQNYEISSLKEEDCTINPFLQFEKWFNNALEKGLLEPNAMQLATVDDNLQPSVRTVLLKKFNKDGFVFFTNYESKKGKEIKKNKKVALLFWFKEHEQQIKIEGIATKLSLKENEIYFHSRPKDSQLAATISNQSEVVENRAYLEQLFQQKQKEFKDKEIPLKKSWGGYLVKPTLFEFWQGRPNRLHDRIQYTKNGKNWVLERLQP